MTSIDKIVSEKYKDLDTVTIQNNKEYSKKDPFPNIVFDDFFSEDYLNEILKDFPNLNKSKHYYEFNSKDNKKLVATSTKIFSDKLQSFIFFLNSHIFLNFLQKLTGIKETLISDPYLWGGGLHQINKGGFLKIHSDFNIHPQLKLNRRINLLIYLNKNWKEDWGGHLELWNKDMSKCEKKILPIFNRMVIFNTNDFSYHGHPVPMLCPDDQSRKSIALYYYSNGRPESEIDKKNQIHSTLFQNRKNTDDDVDKTKIEFKKIFGKFYIRKKSTY